MNKTEQKAILFDLDGTLLDSAPDLVIAANKLFAAHGKDPISFEKLRPLAGEGTVWFIEMGFGYKPSKEEFLPLRDELVKYYIETRHQNTRLFPGIENLLSELLKRNIPWGIVTNKPMVLTADILNQYPILGEAQTIVCGDTLDKAKPHPDPIWLACQDLNCTAANSVYIGDHERDVLAAKAAGSESVVALYGYIPNLESAQNWPADVYVESVTELHHWLNNWIS